ncbi:MAG: hypothetical protein M3N47_11770 [Chloroflexota bacterium]|nr:hypothetical protein [Chloroflexota bacterium]
MLTAPDGSHFTTPEDPNTPYRDDRFWVVHDRERKTTYVLALGPLPGSWRVTTAPGSDAIGSMALARSLPPVKVAAQLAGRGRNRRLMYDVTRIPGQRVDFVEVGGSVTRRIATQRTSTRAGSVSTISRSVRFSPAEGRAGRRRIVAFVSQNGVPRRVISLRSFRAPGPSLPGKPRRVRLRHRGPRLLIAWKPGQGRRATRYDVRVRLPRGRTLRFLTKRRLVRVDGVAWSQRPVVTIRGLRSDGLGGKRAIVKAKRAERPRSTLRLKRGRSRR